MLDGFAICGDDQDYERTYLDKINIDTNYINTSDKKMFQINKLFENENEFDPDGYNGCLDPLKIINLSSKNKATRRNDRRKLRKR